MNTVHYDMCKLEHVLMVYLQHMVTARNLVQPHCKWQDWEPAYYRSSTCSESAIASHVTTNRRLTTHTVLVTDLCCHGNTTQESLTPLLPQPLTSRAFCPQSLEVMSSRFIPEPGSRTSHR